MKKAVLNGIVLILALIFLGACSAPKVEEAENVIINYWSIFPPGDPLTIKHDEMLQDFQTQNPNIEVRHLGTNFWDYWQKIRTAQAGDAEPEISFGDITNVKFRAKSGILADLDSFMSRDNVSKEDFLPNDIIAVSYNDLIYALPFISDSRLFYWNKDHFVKAGLDPEQPPRTLEEIEIFAEKLTIFEDESNRRLQQVGFHPRLGNNSIWQIVWPQGGDFFDDQGNPTVNTPENLGPLEWWVRMCRKYPVRAMNAFSSKANAARVSPFITGDVSMIIDGDWLAWNIETINPELNFGVTSVPYSDEKYRASWSGGFTLEMSARAEGEVAEAAWKLIKFLTSFETQSKTIEYFNWVPANLRALEEVKKTANEKQRFVLEESKFRRHVEFIEAAPEWWIYVDPEVTNAEAGKKDIQTALNDAQRSLETVINNFNRIENSNQ